MKGMPTLTARMLSALVAPRSAALIVLSVLLGATAIHPASARAQNVQNAQGDSTTTAGRDAVEAAVPPTPSVTLASEPFGRGATSSAPGAGLRALGTDSVRAILAPRVRVRPPPPVHVAGGGVRPLAVAKWSSLLATLGAAVYGFAASMGADDHYARIEDACAEVAERCLVSEADGRYVDPEIDGWDRQAETLDRRARAGLLASQVGVATSIVLFVLDLRDTGAPPNVPYGPSGLHVGMSGSGLRVEVRLPAP